MEPIDRIILLKYDKETNRPTSTEFRLQLSKAYMDDTIQMVKKKILRELFKNANPEVC